MEILKLMTLCIICIFIGVYGRVVGASPRGPQPRQVIVGKRSSGTLLRIIGILSTEYSFCQVIVHLCPHGRSPILPDLQSWHKCLNPPRPRGRSHVSEGYLYVVQLLKSAPPSRAESLCGRPRIRPGLCLNPPRPRGRSPCICGTMPAPTSLNPPRPRGRSRFIG